MVDLAIAANFVRELTEDQFAEKQRIRSRNAAAQRSVDGSSASQRASGRTEKTRVRRTIARLAQVRG
jgi:hypothetical protein